MGHFPFFEAYEETLLTQKFKSISLGIFKFIIRFSKKKKKKNCLLSTYFITNIQCRMIYLLTNQITHIIIF